MLKLLTKILNWNSKLLKEQERDTKRMCSKCKEMKPLDAQHYQVVKLFKQGFSYYCNDCNKPKPKD
jgi:hypothetical protein